MTRQTALRWLERGLIAAGVVLAVYCAAILVEARFHQSVPLAQPPLTVTQTVLPALPGDRGDAKASTTPVPTAGTMLGRLEAPTVKLSTVVLEGSDDATLSRGSGHIEDTPFPGQPGNVGIAGHRDTTFRALRHIKIGDALDYRTADRLYRYRISKTWIVGPDDVYVLDPTPQPALTLVTCYPFEFVGHAPNRFIVRAELTGEESLSAGASGGSVKPGR